MSFHTVSLASFKTGVDAQIICWLFVLMRIHLMLQLQTLEGVKLLLIGDALHTPIFTLTYSFHFMAIGSISNWKKVNEEKI